MSATVKTSKKTAKATEVPAVAVAVVPKTKSKKETKVDAKETKVDAKDAKVEAKETKVEAKEAKETKVETPVEAVEEDVSVSLQKTITDLQEQLTALKTAFGTASATLKTLEKQAARVVKKADRRRKRKTEAVEGAEPKPCIFTKPVKISTELCAFLGKPKDTEVSRSAVTKGVMAYARANNLMDKQTIKADAQLLKLLSLKEGDSLTILNLQKYLRNHYIKASVA